MIKSYPELKVGTKVKFKRFYDIEDKRELDKNIINANFDRLGEIGTITRIFGSEPRYALNFPDKIGRYSNFGCNSYEIEPINTEEDYLKICNEGENERD